MTDQINLSAIPLDDLISELFRRPVALTVLTAADVMERTTAFETEEAATAWLVGKASKIGDNMSGEGGRSVEDFLAMDGLLKDDEADDEEEAADRLDWEIGDRAYCPDQGDRGEIVEIIDKGLSDADRGIARVKMQLDYWKPGELWEGSIGDLDRLDDE